jgi:hypothetical protein
VEAVQGQQVTLARFRPEELGIRDGKDARYPMDVLWVWGGPSSFFRGGRCRFFVHTTVQHGVGSIDAT